MIKKICFSNYKGQAMVIVLLVVTIVLSWVIENTIANISYVNTANESANGDNLLLISEGYLENGAIRYLRNQSYNGESLQTNGYSCTITVAAVSGGFDIISICSKDNRQKKVGITVTSIGRVFSFSKIAERP